MANNLSFSVDLNTKGYTEGCKQAEQANKGLKDSTKSYLESFGSLKKQMLSAKKEALNLSGAFAQLSKTEKESEIGKQMASELELAIKKAAELQDVFSDTQERIKREASDTQGWDAMSDAFSIGKDLAIAYAGAVGKLTGNEKALKDMIATVAMVQGGANAAVKIGNALQKQSNVMIAINNIQLKAKAVAEELATKKTIAATAAQKVFNAVAKANPYVLLASVAIAAAAAIGGYMLATQKATKEEDKSLRIKKELNATTLEGVKDAQKEVVSLDILYNAATNINKPMGERLAAVKKIREEYPGYFKDLSDEAILTGQAADKYKELKHDILEAAKARAYQTKIEKLAEEAVDLDDQIEKQKEVAKAARQRAEEMKKASMNSGVQGVANVNVGSMAADSAAEQAKKEEKALEKLNQQRAENTKQQEKYKEKLDETSSSVQKLENNTKQIKPVKVVDKKDLDKTKTELEKLEADVTKWQKALENIDIKAPDANEVIKYVQENLKKAQDAVKNYKIKVGIEIPKEEVDKAAEKAKQELEKELSSISDITKELNKPQDKKYDFSFLPENFQSDADNALERLNKIKDAREKYQKIIDSSKNDAAIQKANEALAQTNDEYTKLIAKVEKYNSLSSQIGKHAKGIEKINNAMGSISNVVGSIDGVVNSFESLGNAFKEGANGWEIFMGLLQTGISIMNAVTTVMTVINTIQDLMNIKKAVGNSSIMEEAAGNEANVIAQTQEIGTTSSLMGVQAAAIPITLALATAYKKLAAAQIFAAHAYIPFVGVGIASGQIAAMEAVFASLLAFEQGGVVPGNSFTGDKMLIRANSGERVLTAKQNENIEKIASGVVGNGLSSNTIHVEGRISGKDLLLVQKNYNTVSPHGQKITF